MAVLPKILLVDNDRNISGVLSEALKNSYDIQITATGKQAIYKCDIYSFDVILLDLNLEDLSGVEMCQLLKERGIVSPILVISGDKNVLRKIEMLDAGASDYLSKPFSLGELKARIRVLLRNKSPLRVHRPLPLSSNGVLLNKNSNLVMRDGNEVVLRRKEFELLEYLMANEGLVISREELINALWPNSEGVWTNTLDVHIKYLRDKIDKPFSVALIQTVHGRGYKFGQLSSLNKANISLNMP